MFSTIISDNIMDSRLSSVKPEYFISIRCNNVSRTISSLTISDNIFGYCVKDAIILGGTDTVQEQIKCNNISIVYNTVNDKNTRNLIQFNHCAVYDSLVINNLFCADMSDLSSPVIRQTPIIVTNSAVIRNSVIEEYKWGSQQVQNSSSIKKSRVAIESGTTTQRPVLNDMMVGFQYFDTTLNKPIYWNGTAWVDATGATV